MASTSRDAAAVLAAVSARGPDAVAHLAGVRSCPTPRPTRSPRSRTHVAGTINVHGGRPRQRTRRRRSLSPAPLMCTATPSSSDLPLVETTVRCVPRLHTPCRRLAQESVAIAYAHAIRTACRRHDAFVQPRRSRTEAGVRGTRPRSQGPRTRGRHGSIDIPVGNLDVRRDMSDVRDVVDAYVPAAPERAAAGDYRHWRRRCQRLLGPIGFYPVDRWKNSAGWQASSRGSVSLTIARQSRTTRPRSAAMLQLIEQDHRLARDEPLAQTLADVWASISTLGRGCTGRAS